MEFNLLKIYKNILKFRIRLLTNIWSLKKISKKKYKIFRTFTTNNNKLFKKIEKCNKCFFNKFSKTEKNFRGKNNNFKINLKRKNNNFSKKKQIFNKKSRIY